MKRIGGFFWKLIVKIAHAILTVLYKIIKKDLTDEAFASWLQFIKFGMVGLMNTLLNYVITEFGYFLLHDHMKDTLALQISQTTGFMITVLISFLINNALVFTKKPGEKRNPWMTLLKTYIAYSVTGIFLNNILVYLEMEYLHISPVIAPIINLVVDVPVNFFLNKLWAYKTEPENVEES